MATITDLPTREPAEERLEAQVNKSSDGGENLPVLYVWHKPAHGAGVSAIAAGPRERVDQSTADSRRSGRSVCLGQGGLQETFQEKMEPAERWNEPIRAEISRQVHLHKVPDFLHCMFPAEGALTPDDTSKLEARMRECEGIFVGPRDFPGLMDIIAHTKNIGDAKPIKHTIKATPSGSGHVARSRKECR